jgi:hypothetical protein
MLTSRSTGGYPPLYVLSTLFFIMALGGVVVLVFTDCLHHYDVTAMHQRLDSLPLIMIGLSSMTVHLGTKLNRADRLKGVFLGIAFMLWGGEQLIPPSQISTLMDEGAVTIFVIDVSFIIWSRLSLAQSEPAH